jgi:hypothetical protein
MLKGRVNHSKGVNMLKGRVNHSKGVYLQVHMRERHHPRLLGQCHGLIRPGRVLRSGRLLGVVCLPRWDHAIQQDLLR